VPGLINPVAVSAGLNHTCALDATGVVCWGAGTTNTGNFPEFGQSIVPALMNPVAVSAGGWHTCALDTTGVVCWGAGTTNTGSNFEYGQSIVSSLYYDKDLDGLADSVEDANGNGIVDAGETNPLNPDTDADGFNDGMEVSYGSDPLSQSDTPANGDVNNDGVVNAADVLLVTRIITGQYTASNDEEIRADVAPFNGTYPEPDGDINAGDLLRIQQMAVGWQ
jgi:hypothetical protein